MSFVACEGFKFTFSCCEESYFICFSAELVFLSQTEAAEDRFRTASFCSKYVPGKNSLVIAVLLPYEKKLFALK